MRHTQINPQKRRPTTRPQRSLPVTGASVSQPIRKKAVAELCAALALRYDPRSITCEEQFRLAQDLVDLGAINFKGFALLTYRSETKEPIRHEAAAQNGNPSIPGSGGGQDWIAHWQLELEQAEADPRCASYAEHLRDLLALLLRIQDARVAVPRPKAECMLPA